MHSSSSSWHGMDVAHSHVSVSRSYHSHLSQSADSSGDDLIDVNSPKISSLCGGAKGDACRSTASVIVVLAPRRRRALSVPCGGGRHRGKGLICETEERKHRILTATANIADFERTYVVAFLVPCFDNNSSIAEDEPNDGKAKVRKLHSSLRWMIES